MKTSGAILLDFQSAVDYCQPSLPDHNVTREVINYIHDEGIRLDMRKSCWQSLSSTLTNVLNLFQYLRDKATSLLRRYNSQQALDEYLGNILTNSTFRSQKSLSLNQNHMPAIEDLRSAVDEMGMENFRAYADNQVQNCVDSQGRLDLIINQRFERGGQSVGMFNAIVDSHFDLERNIELLITAYVWGTDVQGFLLTRQTSTIYSRREKIYESMSSQKFNIISPQDIKQYLS